MTVTHTFGDGRQLVAIHGFGLDRRSMLPLKAMIGSMQRRRVYADLPWTEAEAEAGRSTKLLRRSKVEELLLLDTTGT